MNEPLQGMLFGTTSTDGTPTGASDSDELRICALNVNSPSRKRASLTVDWLLATDSNTLVLSEMQPSDGGQYILAALEAEGYAVTCSRGWQQSRYFAVVATRGTTAAPVTPESFDPRIAVADVTAGGGATVRVVGIYAPTNGMSIDSSHRRRTFQTRLVEYLTLIKSDTMCVLGDLNVVEPDHRPRLPAFEAHDYSFYTSLTDDLGLRDVYRAVKPDGGDHSWISARLGNQRLDHALISPASSDIQSCSYDHSTRSADISDHAALLATITMQPRTA